MRCSRDFFGNQDWWVETDVAEIKMRVKKRLHRQLKVLCFQLDMPLIVFVQQAIIEKMRRTVVELDSRRALPAPERKRGNGNGRADMASVFDVPPHVPRRPGRPLRGK